MENTFDLAYRSYGKWTSDQCSRMLDALRKRLSDEQETALDEAGVFDNDALFRPVSEEQLRRELLNAQAAYERGDYVDALEFCNVMERRNA